MDITFILSGLVLSVVWLFMSRVVPEAFCMATDTPFPRGLWEHLANLILWPFLLLFMLSFCFLAGMIWILFSFAWLVTGKWPG